VDIEFPNHWKIPKKYVQEDKIIENQKVNENKRFFSFVSEFNEDVLNKTVENIKNIIAYNKEIEMKESLLKQDRAASFDKIRTILIQYATFEHNQNHSDFKLVKVLCCG
jgi:hypothetical protein